MNDTELENITFLRQSLDKAVTYRLSLAQRESNNYQILEDELPNLWESIQCCYQQKFWQSVMSFRDALQLFLDKRGYWTLSLTLNEWACEAARVLGDRANLARWTHDRAGILQQQGKYGEAEQLYQVCEEAYYALGENVMAMKSRHMRSLAVRAQGRVTEAEHLCQLTIVDARSAGLDQWLAHPLYVLALFARDRGDFRKAELCIEESLSRLVDTKEFAMIAQCHHTLGELALLQGNLAKARTQLERSLGLGKQISSLRRVAATQRLLGNLARTEGNYEQAWRAYEEALEIANRLGDQPEMGRLLLEQARLMKQLGQTDRAITLLRGSLAVYQAIRHTRGVAEVSQLLAWLYLRQGK